MSERLWSPQMRKWARDADRHGIPIGLYKHRPSRYAGSGDGVGAGLANTVRMTDDGGVRVIDAPHNTLGGPRRIDRIVL